MSSGLLSNLPDVGRGTQSPQFGDHLWWNNTTKAWTPARSPVSFSVATGYPLQNGTGTTSPATHGAVTARVFPFYFPHYMSVNAVCIKTASAVANCLQWAIFDSTGARVFTTGAQSAVNGWVVVTAGTPFTMTPGQYYGASTNNNSASASLCLTTSVSLGAASVPRYGTVAATAGAMPASIDPTAITETVGAFINQVVLSGVTT